MRKKNKINNIETSIKSEVSRFNLQKILVALSGGADSIATAFALKQSNLEVTALHCNFHLRGEESNRDMQFVEDFCHDNGIPLLIKEFDVQDYIAENKGCSIEMACRNLRHEWFREILTELNADRIATGHNADDNIETFFLNLLRGSGTRGLRGMVSDTGVIWRPLLHFHRSQILEYLEINNLSFVTDSTNLQCDYRRNFLRNRIIPLFKEEWKGFDSAMDKSLSHLSEENIVVEEYIEEILKGNNDKLDTFKILSSPAPELIIKRFIEPFGPFTTTPQEILSAIKAKKPHIRRWRLKKGYAFLRNGSLFVEMIHGELGA